MIRVEIIANHSVEDNILEALNREGAGKYYTRFPGVYGVGRQGPRMGDAIWPEENFALVIWCENAEAAAIERAVLSVKKQFPDEGIKCFGLPGHAAPQLPPPDGSYAAPVTRVPEQPPVPVPAAESGAPAAGAADAAPPAAGGPARQRPGFGGETF
jgi:hypothetical protein